MAPIDNGEEKIERVTSDITRSGTQVMIRYAANQTNRLSKAVIAKGLKAASTSLKWTMAAVQKPGGQVSMKELSELPSKTGREVVSLDDKDVMQALEKNLKGRGVHYAIEREKIDGKIEHILHVRGDDAQVVTDSLERAAKAVDAKRELKQERSVERDALKQDQPDKPDAARSNEPAPEQSKTTPAAQDEPKQQPTETKDRQQPEKKPAEKRSNGDTSQKPKEVRQREIREKVKARAEKIKAEAPKPSPKLDAPTPGLKR